jgi:hypothetical protein
VLDDFASNCAEVIKASDSAETMKAKARSETRWIKFGCEYKDTQALIGDFIAGAPTCTIM